MRITKRLTALLLSMLLFTLAACGSELGNQTEIDLQQLATDLLEEAEWSSDMTPLPENLFGRRYQFERNLMAESVLYTSSGYTPEEIALVKLNSTADAVTVQSDFERRIAELKETFSDYETQHLPMLDNPYLATHGPYVIFVVSGDSQTVSTVIDEAFSAR